MTGAPQSAGDLPVRLITRQVLENTFNATMEWKRAFDGHHLSMLVWLSIDLANTEHLFAQTDLPLILQDYHFEDSDRRPISVRALGNSLGLDAETIRRCASRLVDGGYCERRAGGLTVRSASYERVEIRAASARSLKELSSLFQALEYWAMRSELSLPQVIQSHPWEGEIGIDRLRCRLFVLLFMQFVLRFGAEMQSTFERDLMTKNTFLCIFTSNSRRLLNDDALNIQYSTLSAPPPAELRDAISIRGIARRLSASVETTRRHVARLVELGLVEKQSGGFMVSAGSLTRPAFLKAVGDINASLLLMLRRMERVAAVLDREG